MALVHLGDISALRTGRRVGEEFFEERQRLLCMRRVDVTFSLARLWIPQFGAKRPEQVEKGRRARIVILAAVQSDAERFLIGTREEFRNVSQLIVGCRRREIVAVFAFERGLFFRIVEQIAAIHQTHAILIDRQGINVARAFRILCVAI